MFKKIFQAIVKHKIITAIVIIILSAGGYYGYNLLKGGSSSTSYVLAAVQKGTLITSVSGSGQVSVSDQVDVKPKVSGDAVYVSVNKDQEVKAGTLLVQIDSRDAQRAVSDAEIALENAKINLEDLLSPPGAAQSLLQAENALAQAERDLEKAEKTYNNIEADAESTLAGAYENGYSDVSTSFFKLSDYMKDLQDVFGTEKNEQGYIDVYKIILGADSPFIQKLVDDYYQTKDLYNKNFTFFRGVFQNDDRDTVYRLINDTLETTKAISQALESARHVFDIIMVSSYQHFNAASQIDKMQPKIESDVSSIFSTISSLGQTIDTIDNTVQDTPDKIKDAELAFASAKEKLAEKQQSLEELKAGATPLDIRTQQNIVAQKETALTAAKEKFVNYFIRAPFDGIIAKVDVKKGDSVSGGTAVATIITKQSIAEISLNEVDAAQVKVGQKATLTFDAIEELSIAGQVADVDTLGTVTQGVVNYNAKISFDTQDSRVKPGMSTSAQIIIEAKPDVLLVPNSAIKTINGASYVQALDQLQTQSASISQSVTSLLPPRQIAVQIGLSNDTSTEITSGLKEGDQIVSRTITSSSQTTTSQAPSLFGGGNTGNTFRAIGR